MYIYIYICICDPSVVCIVTSNMLLLSTLCAQKLSHRNQGSGSHQRSRLGIILACRSF